METGLVATTTTTTTTRPQYVPSWGIWTAKLSLRCVQVALAAAVLGLTGSIYGMEAGRELPFIIASAPVGPPNLSLSLCLFFFLPLSETIARRISALNVGFLVWTSR